MSWRNLTAILSATTSGLGAALCLLGTWGMTRFYEYNTIPYDPKMYLFDDGLSPYMWGLVVMTLGVLLRLRWHRYAMAISGSLGLAVGCWMLWTHPGERSGVELFPEVEVLQILATASVVMLALAGLDWYLRRRKTSG